MVRLFTIITLLLSFQIYSEETSLQCEDLLIIELQNFLERDQDQFIARLYAQAVFKVAAMARHEGGETTEGFVRSLNRRLSLISPRRESDERLLIELEDLYRRHGLTQDLMDLEESIQAANPWRANLRLDNQSMAQVLLAHQHLNPHSPFTESDAAVVWFVHQLFESIGHQAPPGSLLYNQIALSTSVTRLIRHQPSGDELLASFEDEQRKIIQFIDDLYDTFLDQHADQCSGWLELERCTGDQFLQRFALPTVLQELMNNAQEAIEFSLMDGLRASLPNGIQIRLRELTYTPPPQREVSAGNAPTQDFERLPEQVLPSPRRLQVQELRLFEERFREIGDEESKLHFFHRELEAESSLYGVIDRQAATLSFYRDGNLVYQAPLSSPQGLSDRHEHGGSGIYGFAYQQTRGLFFLTDQRERNTAFRLLSHDSRAYELLHETERIYVLPVEDHLEFRLREGRLVFTHQRQLSHTHLYNFTPRQTSYRPLRTEITDPNLINPMTTEFVATLDREKQTLMELYGLDNDDYNELARMSFGILGNESQFGQSLRYRFKETFPWVVSLAKGDGFDTSQNSRGPTQIKNVPILIQEHYQVTKESLKRPDHAAVATLGFLAQSLQELKNREHHHPGITPYNRMDYLHYIYMGRVVHIARGTATPERNIYFRNMRQAADSLIQWEELPAGP